MTSEHKRQVQGVINTMSWLLAEAKSTGKLHETWWNEAVAEMDKLEKAERNQSMV